MSKGKQPRTRVKVPKLLLSEKKGCLIQKLSGNRLRSGPFFEDLVTEHWFSKFKFILIVAPKI